MVTTLPTYSEQVDNRFINTWYDIRADSIDNILLATPVWAALRAQGCFTTQVGGKSIERTVKYAYGTASAFGKGDVLPEGEVETETAAFWTFRYVQAHVQRTLIDDAENNGTYKIKSYVGQRLTAARDALTQKFETDLWRATVTAETGKEIQGLNDLVPLYTDRATGTYGKIARSNSWWQPKYKIWSGVRNVYLLPDMRTAYNYCDNQQNPPKLIITTQTLFELYEDFAQDKVQIVKDAGSFLVDLGFQVLRFKGKPMIYTPNITADNMLMLNTDFIEVVTDPQVWFDFTPWRDTPKQFERLANIVCRLNILGTQPRRHIRLNPDGEANLAL